MILNIMTAKFHKTGLQVGNIVTGVADSVYPRDAAVESVRRQMPWLLPRELLDTVARPVYIDNSTGLPYTSAIQSRHYTPFDHGSKAYKDVQPYGNRLLHEMYDPALHSHHKTLRSNHGGIIIHYTGPSTPNAVRVYGAILEGALDGYPIVPVRVGLSDKHTQQQIINNFGIR